MFKTSWDLTQLYKSPNDPAIERDIARIKSAYTRFEKKYRSKQYLQNDALLLKALQEYVQLDALPNPLVYLHLFGDIDSSNSTVIAKQTAVAQIFTALANSILFFRLSLMSFSKQKQKEILTNKSFSKYHYFLRQIFSQATYSLSEAEEKILNLQSLPAQSLWVDGQSKLLSEQTIHYGKKEIPINEALEIIKNLPTKKRHQLHSLVMKKLKAISNFAESEINAIVINKKISDELRKYKKPYSQTLLQYQNDEKTIEALVESVKKYFHVSHRFYSLKRSYAKVKTFSYADRSVGIGRTTKKVSFDKAVQIVRNAFHKVNPRYEEIFLQYLTNGQIDVYPKKGKRGGAYCWTNSSMPTFVLLNHADTLNSVSTLAHEMGHAIHGEFSKSQPLLYQGHTISVAEVASTLFENFAFEELFSSLSESDKIIALHDRILDDIQTIFRQIALFNFEVELHAAIREKGFLSKELIAQMMNKHMASYLGNTFSLTEEDGYFFVTWSHIRRFFYVYSYAYGQIISKALYKKYKENPAYINKIEEFLKAGESKSPEEIFSSIGINTKDTRFFEEGLKAIEEDVKRLEKLLKSATKKR
jgi:oligoendopeptidase F